jgi:hypothetical protein
MLGYDGEEVRFAWDCFELECGIPTPLLVRVAVSGRRNKRKHLGLLCLGLGLGKLGLGFPGLGFGSVGLVAGSVGLCHGLVGPVFGFVSGLNVISCPDLAEVLMVSSMVVDKHI